MSRRSARCLTGQPADPSVNATPDLSYAPWPQLPTDAMRASTLPGSPSIRPSLPSGLRHTKVGVPFRPIAVAIAMFWRRRCGASALGGLSTPPVSHARNQAVRGITQQRQRALRALPMVLIIEHRERDHRELDTATLHKRAEHLEGMN